MEKTTLFVDNLTEESKGAETALKKAKIPFMRIFGQMSKKPEIIWKGVPWKGISGIKLFIAVYK